MVSGKASPSRKAIRTERASTLSGVVAAATLIADSWRITVDDAEEIWYRGHCFQHQRLVPSLYRPDNAGYADVESSLVARFQGLAIPLVQKDMTEWEWYFLARHHGIPTRLLDWSESLVIAVRFAVSGYCAELGDRIRLNHERQQRPSSAVFDRDSPCIWMLEAGTLNNFAMQEDLTFIPGGNRTKPYLPEFFNPESKKSRYPIAIAPQRSNARLAAQRGTFTLHGSLTNPLEDYATGKMTTGAQRKSTVRLAKIVLDRSRLAHIAHELEIAGVDMFGLFPDLDHVAEQARWEYKQAQRTFADRT